MKKIKPITWTILLLIVLLVAVAVYLTIDLIKINGAERYVTLGQYENLAITVDVKTPDEKEEQEYLQERIVALTPPKTVTDGAKSGDNVIFDFTGTENGQPIQDFSGQNATVVLGKDEFVVSGLDQHLVGTKPGKSVKAILSVAEDHPLTDIAGKTIEVAVTVKDVTRATSAELTQQWVTENTDYATVDEFKAAIKAEYEQGVADTNSATIRTQLWGTVIEASEVKQYPFDRLRKLQEEYRSTFEKKAKEYEMEFIDYVSFATGVSTLEEFEEHSLVYNQSLLKQELVLEALCKKEKITLNDQEYQTYLQQYTDLFAVEGFTQEEMIEYYGGEDLLRQQFLLEKVTDTIESTATVTTE